MLRQQIVDQMKSAMRTRDTVRLAVMRYLLSEIKNQEIDTKHELSDEEVVVILRREVKRRSEAIPQFEQGGRSDLADAEKAELVYIQEFLPQAMSPQAIEAIVDRILAEGETNFGLVMKAVMQETKGQADGKVVSEIVKAKLS